MKNTRTPALILTLAPLLLYASSASPQGASSQGAAPTGQPAHDVADSTDEALTKAIHSALDADPNHYFRHVTVSVDKGVATLGGFVHSSSAIYRARTIAGKVPGVSRVVTNLQLEPNRPR